MTGHNPDLPILDELGAEFEAMVSAAWARRGRSRAGEGEPEPIRRRERGAASASPTARPTAMRLAVAPRTPSRATRERGAQARRVGRRAAIVLVLVCLSAASPSPPCTAAARTTTAHTAPTPLGRAADGAWSFSAYRDEGRLCTVFVPRGGELSGNCGEAPGPRAGARRERDRRRSTATSSASPGRGRAGLDLARRSALRGATGGPAWPASVPPSTATPRATRASPPPTAGSCSTSARSTARRPPGAPGGRHPARPARATAPARPTSTAASASSRPPASGASKPPPRGDSPSTNAPVLFA